MKEIKKAIASVLKDMPYAAITVITTLLSLTIYYATLISSTPWEIFIESNSNFFITAQIILSVLNAILIGLVTSMVLYVLQKRRQDSNLTFLQALASLLFSVAATGCTVCGAVLLPTLGIAASLAALPLAGLEIKILTILLLIYSIYEYAKIISGKCDVNFKSALIINKVDEGYDLIFTNKIFLYLKPLAVIIVFFALLTLLPSVPRDWKVDFSRSQTSTVSIQENSQDGSQELQDFTEQINPSKGYNLNVTYGDIGPKIIKAGAIDLEGFKQVYKNAGQPLTEEQIAILTKGSDQEIVINRENSYFLLNFFWAFGLSNQNSILTEGEIAKYGDGQIEGFASTGGWNLASKDFSDYYSKTAIVPLTKEQQKLVEEVSSNIYRPCCGNPTSFPDCNHGMALLGVLEIMAANGANENELYEASKYINAFWFPSTYNDLAMYFKATENKDFADIDAKTLLSNEFSSGSGYQSKKNWMQQQGLLPEPPKTTGGGCGV